MSKSTSSDSSNKNKTKEKADWFPKDYSPELSVKDWVRLLEDPLIFTENSLQVMKRMKDYGGEATCKQLALRYGKSFGYYNSTSSQLAKRVAEKTECPILKRDNGKDYYWTILYMGKYAPKEYEGDFIWRLRSELSQALDLVDLSDVALYENESDLVTDSGVWWLTVNPTVWSFYKIKIERDKDNKNKEQLIQNFNDAKVGDLVISYEVDPIKKIVAIGRIIRKDEDEAIYIKKIEELGIPIDYQTLHECSKLSKAKFLTQPNGSLFKLTKREYDCIMTLIRKVNPLQESIPKYNKQNFLKDVYMIEERYDILEALLLNKMNIILQGAPGVGKTFIAKKLAYAIMGKQDDSRIAMVQFHQNYSYEDFMMGYHPDGAEFKLTYGPFYRFCQKAENDLDKAYFFIIDEINRGNMSKIFGELMMLIEKAYRSTKITVAYDDKLFSVPKNLYIIGMMNTADRSLAMIDYALRRRFSFFEIEPSFNSKGFIDYQNELNNKIFNLLIEQIKVLNDEITKDRSLGKGFCIGHSYFCGKHSKECTLQWMHSIVEYDILPMLSEYWFDEPDKVQKWEKNLRGVFDDK